MTRLIFRASKDSDHTPKIDRVLSRQLISPWAQGVFFSARFPHAECMQCMMYSAITFARGNKIYRYDGCMKKLRDSTGVRSLAHKRVGDGGDNGFDKPESLHR